MAPAAQVKKVHSSPMAREVVKLNSSGAELPMAPVTQVKKHSEKSKQAASRSSKKKRRRPKDMPKRPLSSYNIFFRNERQRMLQPGVPQSAADGEGTTGAAPRECLNLAGLARCISSKWKSLAPQQKASFEAESRKDRARYQNETMIWKQNNKQKQSATVQQAHQHAWTRTASNQHSESPRESGDVAILLSPVDNGSQEGRHLVQKMENERIGKVPQVGALTCNKETWEQHLCIARAQQLMQLTGQNSFQPTRETKQSYQSDSNQRLWFDNFVSVWTPWNKSLGPPMLAASRPNIGWGFVAAPEIFDNFRRFNVGESFIPYPGRDPNYLQQPPLRDTISLLTKLPNSAASPTDPTGELPTNSIFCLYKAQSEQLHFEDAAAATTASIIYLSEADLTPLDVADAASERTGSQASGLPTVSVVKKSDESLPLNTEKASDTSELFEPGSFAPVSTSLQNQAESLSMNDTLAFGEENDGTRELASLQLLMSELDEEDQVFIISLRDP